MIVVIAAAGLAFVLRKAQQKPNDADAFIGDASTSRQISALMKRYKDAYLVATVTNGFGSMVKGIGAVIGGLLLLVGVMVAGNGHPGDATFAVGVLIIAAGIVSGVAFYMLGVLVCAQAQILKASLDGVVNNSPFLTNEHRATLMSLPKA